MSDTFVKKLVFGLGIVVLAFAACSKADDETRLAGGPEKPAVERGEPATEDRWSPPRTSPPYLDARIQSIGKDVLVALHQPDVAVGGLPTNAMTRVGPDGRVVYEYLGDLYVLVADPVLRDAGGDWVYPEDPEENDERLAAPACQGDMEGFYNPDMVGSFWVDPDGRVAYRCPYQDRDPELHYVDGPTVEMGGGLIRWLGSESRALGLGGQWGETWGIDDRGTFTAIDRPPLWTAMRGPNLVLADHEGFLVVFLNPRDSWNRDGLGTLFRVYYDGSVEEIGRYSRPAEPLVPSGPAAVLAPGGEIYVVRQRSDDDVVLRFQPDSAEPGEIVYRVGTGVGTFYRDPWQLDSVVKWGS